MKLILLILIGFSLAQTAYIRNNEIVYDDTTGLYWQDNADAKNLTKTWQGAIDYCKALTLNSQDDWRLPNKNEFLSIVDYSRYTPSVDAIFKNINSQNNTFDYYWSSTTSADDSDKPWLLHFHSGSTYNGNHKTTSFYVRCVRGGQ